MVNSKQHECPRVIQISKYERTNKETFNWWLRLFKIIEDDFKIPPHKRKDVITKIFPHKLLEKILTIISTVERINEDVQDDNIFESEVHKSNETLVSRTNKSSTLLGEQHRDMDLKKHRCVGRVNPYLRFFKIQPERAAIWKDLPPLSIEGMNLNQKSEAITEAIAVDFVEWLKNLGGETPTTLDVTQVMKMFEVGFHTHAATSLAVRVKEMPAVPEYVAKIRKHPEKAYREILKQKIKEDIQASYKKPKSRAFNTTLPKSMRYTPPKQGLADKWLRRKAPERLATMAIVWEGITHLRSTRSFCKYLMDHPEIPSPKYLETKGMLQSSFFEKTHYSIDTNESTSMVDNVAVTDMFNARLTHQ